MKNNQLVETLKELGLTENEAEIYFTTLSLGPSTIMKIARASEIKRTTIYSVIDSLRQKGLVNIQIEGFKKKFVAEDPRKLEEILETRRNRFRSLLPEFDALYNLKGGESFIKYYEGVSAIKGVYESLIRDVKPHDDYLVMGNQDYWLSLDKEFFMDFLYRRAKLPINIRMMFQESKLAHEWKSQERNFNSRVKILPPNTKLNTNLVITPQRVFIHQLIHPIIGIVIENKSVIQMHKEMYEVIWNALKEENDREVQEG
jgi:sugar-specific transcriptional regulator TrmB